MYQVNSDLKIICYTHSIVFVDIAHAIDDFAVDKIRQIEVKYPVIKTPTEEVMNTLNRKAELFLLAINSVKDKTNSAIQYSKETVN